MAALNPEFARPVRLDTLGGAPHAVEVAADEVERAALAQRFALLELPALAATAELVREGDTVLATGRVRASVVQACVATAEPVPAEIDEPFALRFVPERAAGPEEEVELDEGDLDELAYAGSAVDIGEAAAQTLALALDPFPRSPAADSALRDAGVVREGEEPRGAFGALAALRDKLAGPKD